MPTELREIIYSTGGGKRKTYSVGLTHTDLDAAQLGTDTLSPWKIRIPHEAILLPKVRIAGAGRKHIRTNLNSYGDEAAVKPQGKLRLQNCFDRGRFRGVSCLCRLPTVKGPLCFLFIVCFLFI